MTIEELDDPSQGRSTDHPTEAGRARLLAATAGVLLGLTVFAAVQLAGPSAARGAAEATHGAAAVATVPARATSAVSFSCPRTTKSDSSGVITTNGTIGIVGDTFSQSGEGIFLIVRRGAAPGDSMHVQLIQFGATAPAPWVQYTVLAADQTSRTPWGDKYAFQAGWKPIGFPGSCWVLVVDGVDTGLILAVGP